MTGECKLSYNSNRVQVMVNTRFIYTQNVYVFNVRPLVDIDLSQTVLCVHTSLISPFSFFFFT